MPTDLMRRVGLEPDRECGFSAFKKFVTVGSRRARLRIRLREIPDVSISARPDVIQLAPVDTGVMARDIFTEFHRCSYCDRTGTIVWDVDVYSCDHEMCKTLAFAEVRRRHSYGDVPVRKHRWVAFPTVNRHPRLAA